MLAVDQEILVLLESSFQSQRLNQCMYLKSHTVAVSVAGDNNKEKLIEENMPKFCKILLFFFYRMSLAEAHAKLSLRSEVRLKF